MTSYQLCLKSSCAQQRALRNFLKQTCTHQGTVLSCSASPTSIHADRVELLTSAMVRWTDTHTRIRMHKLHYITHNKEVINFERFKIFKARLVLSDWTKTYSFISYVKKNNLIIN